MKKLGFGCMRLPMKDDNVDFAEFTKMVDLYMSKGFNYFDTASVYISNKSEIALRECLVKRYPRESFILTDKLSDNLFNNEEQIYGLLDRQLARCGVEYFDYYLMHAQNATNYQKYKRLHAYEIAQEFIKSGKIKHMGISFHDSAETLEQILIEQPNIEVVQLQFNYLDYNSDSIQSRKCYEVCQKYGKKVLVMEPVKGGTLVNLPDKAKSILDNYSSSLSYASYAIRFAASFDNIIMVLSGMSNLGQMKDNLSYMEDFQPLTEEEKSMLFNVAKIINEDHSIQCTGCQYCVKGCPKQIFIPGLFSCLNSKRKYKDWSSDMYYNVHIVNHGKASDCIGCGQCERNCPQHLPIRMLLKEVQNTFEKKDDKNE